MIAACTKIEMSDTYLHCTAVWHLLVNCIINTLVNKLASTLQLLTSHSRNERKKEIMSMCYNTDSCGSLVYNQHCLSDVEFNIVNFK